MAKAVVKTAGASPSDGDLIRETDSKGRVIALRRLNVLQQMQVLKLYGGENEAYYNLMARLCRVAEIDGDPVAVPQNQIQVEAIAQRLGEDGIAALMVAIQKEAEAALTAAEAEAEDKARAKIKNSASTPASEASSD